MNVVAFAQSSLLPYKNPVLSVDERVKDLLSRMTLEDKVGQLLCPLGWERTMKYILLKSLKD